MYMYIIIVLSRINENPGHLYNILFIGMFELFSEAVRSHYGVQCTCSAEKLVLAVRCLNFPCLIIVYVVTTVVAAKFIRILQVLLK